MVNKSDKGKINNKSKKANKANKTKARQKSLTLRTKSDKEKRYRDKLKEKNEAAIEKLIREQELEDMRELEIGQDPRFPVAAIPDDLTAEEMRRQIKEQEELVKRQKEEEEEELMLASLHNALKTPVNSPIRHDYDDVPLYKGIKYGNIDSPTPKSSPKIRSLPNSPERLPPLPMQVTLKNIHFDFESPKGGKQRKGKRKTSKKRSKKRNTRRRRKN